MRHNGSARTSRPLVEVEGLTEVHRSRSRTVHALAGVGLLLFSYAFSWAVAWWE